jgi:TolA-binding protein
MRKIGFIAVCILMGTLSASCAFRSSKRVFGPYSEAEAFYNKGNYSKAIEKYQEYLASNPQGNLAAIAEYYIAKSYLVSGKQVEAQQGFQRVVSEFPGTSWAEFAKDQLQILQDPGKV